jgi:hypothetical protein
LDPRGGGAKGKAGVIREFLETNLGKEYYSTPLPYSVRISPVVAFFRPMIFTSGGPLGREIPKSIAYSRRAKCGHAKVNPLLRSNC